MIAVATGAPALLAVALIVAGLVASWWWTKRCSDLLAEHEETQR